MTTRSRTIHEIVKDLCDTITPGNNVRVRVYNHLSVKEGNGYRSYIHGQYNPELKRMRIFISANVEVVLHEFAHHLAAIAFPDLAEKRIMLINTYQNYDEKHQKEIKDVIEEISHGSIFETCLKEVKEQYEKMYSYSQKRHHRFVLDL